MKPYLNAFRQGLIQSSNNAIRDFLFHKQALKVVSQGRPTAFSSLRLKSSQPNNPSVKTILLNCSIRKNPWQILTYLIWIMCLWEPVVMAKGIGHIDWPV